MFYALGELLGCCVGGMGAREECLGDVCGWCGRGDHFLEIWLLDPAARELWWDVRALEVVEAGGRRSWSWEKLFDVTRR